MAKIGEILHSKAKSKEKQNELVEAVISTEIPIAEFIRFFESANNVDQGACADAMKHISEKKPELLAPYIDLLSAYVNNRLPRVKWGVPEAIGNLAKDYPVEAAKAIPNLLKNTTADKENTTVIKWCAAYALSQIAMHNPATRKQLTLIFQDLIKTEGNAGVRNVYVRALKIIERK